MIYYGTKVHITFINGRAEEAIFSRVEWGLVFIIDANGNEVGIPLTTIKNMVEKAK
jgi:hypothetical protein